MNFIWRPGVIKVFPGPGCAAVHFQPIYSGLSLPKKKYAT
jgi:hypothetical protein